MCTTVFLLYSLFIFAVTIAESNDENQALVRFYTESMSNFTELPLDEAHTMFASPWYDRSKTFCVFAHGFTGKPDGPAVTAVISAFLRHGKCNVALLNWEKLAAFALPGLLNSYLHWAVPNAIQLGVDVAETLLKFSEAGLDLNNTHFVGHSLGAHLFGVAGYSMMEKGIQLPQITGLDPAIGFDSKPPHMRFNHKCAKFASTVNTDPTRYGTRRDLGLVNFWPNYRAAGPVRQPGCYAGGSDTFSSDDFCSHHRAWQLFVDALDYPGTLLGSYAKTFKAWKNYGVDQRESMVAEIGVYDPTRLPGNYYLITADKSPYGLGKDGL